MTRESSNGTSSIRIKRFPWVRNKPIELKNRIPDATQSVSTEAEEIICLGMVINNNNLLGYETDEASSDEEEEATEKPRIESPKKNIKEKLWRSKKKNKTESEGIELFAAEENF